MNVFSVDITLLEKNQKLFNDSLFTFRTLFLII
jgi:hypothetical protein